MKTESVKSTIVDGTSIQTIRIYQSTKYPFSIKEEFRNESNKVVEKIDKGEENSILVSLDYNYARKVPTISYVKLPWQATVKDK